jgi:hypothetical protein
MSPIRCGQSAIDQRVIAMHQGCVSTRLNVQNVLRPNHKSNVHVSLAQFTFSPKTSPHDNDIKFTDLIQQD